MIFYEKKGYCYGYFKMQDFGFFIDFFEIVDFKCRNSFKLSINLLNIQIYSYFCGNSNGNVIKMF